MEALSPGRQGSNKGSPHDLYVHYLPLTMHIIISMLTNRFKMWRSLQIEVTFNFLEIRAMNSHPEHQVNNIFLGVLNGHVTALSLWPLHYN
jgi:hypothetical protein